MDFTTASSEVGVVIESFPEVENRLVARFGTRVDEDTAFGLDDNQKSSVNQEVGRTLSIFPMALKSQRWELIFF